MPTVGKASIPPRAAAVAAAPRPNLPRNCRRDTFVAASSAIWFIFSSMFHLLLRFRIGMSRSTIEPRSAWSVLRRSEHPEHCERSADSFFG
jgi:hypothetical protein